MRKEFRSKVWSAGLTKSEDDVLNAVRKRTGEARSKMIRRALAMLLQHETGAPGALAGELKPASDVIRLAEHGDAASPEKSSRLAVQLWIESLRPEALALLSDNDLTALRLLCRQVADGATTLGIELWDRPEGAT